MYTPLIVTGKERRRGIRPKILSLRAILDKLATRRRGEINRHP
jgi:hypothetical protein